MKTHTQHMLALILSGFIAASATSLPAQEKSAQDNAALEERMARIEKMLEALAASQAAQPAPAATAPAAAAAAAAPAADAPPATEYKKGLWLNLYQIKKQLKSGMPDWNPFGAMVVDKQPMSPGALEEDAEYKSYAKTPMYFMWEGYLKITTAGEHTLVMEVSEIGTANRATSFSTGIYIEKSLLVERKMEAISNNSTIAISADVTLQPGVYAIQIPLVPELKYEAKYSNLSVSIKMTEPGSRRARVLTSDDLLHKD